MKHKTIMSVFVLFLLMSCTIPLALADEKTSSGSAIVGNSTPTITESLLTGSSGGTDKNNSALSVNTEYWANATVGDGNSLLDILNITIYVFDSSSTTYASADANATHYTFKYLNSTDTWSEVGPNSAGGYHIVTGDCSQPGTKTGTSGVYRLAFKLAYTANYTAANTQWKINMTVYGSTGLSANSQILMFGVASYDSLTIDADSSTHSWTGLAAGNNNVTLSSPADGNVGFTVTSNHVYKIQAHGDANLVNGGNTISIGHIMLYGSNTLASSANMTAAYADVGTLTNLAATESAANAVWLWVSIPSGTPSGTYTYTLTIQTTT